MILSARGIDVYYGKVAAVRDVSFDIEEGKIVTLIGANGAGKTTILKTISGLERAVSGEIVFKGTRIERLLTQDIVRLGIGHVPEGRRLFPGMTVMENLGMGAYLRTQAQEIGRDLDRVFHYFPVLKNRRNQRAGSLSGGEQQMLAIGRALMSSPKLLLLDEPSIGLSPLMNQTIATIISTINQEGVSILLVEQNAKLALKIAHNGYVLETGGIVLQGEAKELLQDEAVKKAYLGV
ncbi:MAG TPA: ABC transporter ATP-binding protein [Desulfomonilaceae bacterium]|nr:ABC transporter ATP-binding protein [Desulfomonilaceae bacterium]